MSHKDKHMVCDECSPPSNYAPTQRDIDMFYQTTNYKRRLVEKEDKNEE